tara:strand:- start:203 stop:343 length:141 start_codon:yes stop_codon:yes gene_type:complete
VIDLVLGVLLTAIVLKINTSGVFGRAACLGSVGLSGAVACFLPQWS